MTRINSHQVIQMVGDDRLVFVEERYNQEVVMPIDEAVRRITTIAQQWIADNDGDADLMCFTMGDPSAFVEFSFVDLEAVGQAISYFQSARLLTPEEHMAQTKVFSINPGESLKDFMKRAGMR